MPAFTVGSVSDGSNITVRDLIGAPMMIPARIIDMLNNSFLTDVIFRNAGQNVNGLVGFEADTPLFLAGDVEDVGEYGEIPVAIGQRGTPRIAVGVKRGLGVRVSREMRDENRLDDVNRQLRQLVNTMIRAEERALRALLLATPNIPTIAASVPWTSPSAVIRHDIAAAQEKIASARPAADLTTEDFLGFEADTMILPGNITPVLLDNEQFLKVYSGEAAQENIAYTGRLPGDVLGLAPLKTRFWDNTRVLVLQRGEIGFRSDTRPLEATGLYPEGNGPNGGPTESWRSDTTRKRVLGVDQGLAACWITGVQAA